MAYSRRSVLRDISVIALNQDEPPKVGENYKRPAFPDDDKTLKTPGKRQQTTHPASRNLRSIVSDAAATPLFLKKKRGADLFRKCLAEHAVTSTPAPKKVTSTPVQKSVRKCTTPSKTTRSAEERVESRSSRGLPECPVSPIAVGLLSRVICPQEEDPDDGSPDPPTSSSPTPLVEKLVSEVRRPAKTCSESENHATVDDFSCGSFNRSLANRSYSRRPKQSTDWELLTNDITGGGGDDENDCYENQETDSDSETVIKADGVNPDDFLMIGGSCAVPTKRGDRTVKRSPLEGGYYSPPTVMKRRRRQKREQPVWDEARYANEFNAMNAEFEQIERTELCVVFEDQSKGGHGVP